ncbi:putative LysR family transcriptional regulator [Actinacidiphila reveromycinica]|uniref:Putative LysR family transcriptional regulator n=1 Tax=Actinacidiphila reveromycinica TaxID=659352 RepID=A0A7U3UX17_9ACTN|nr:LysR family transcriptional regulator [Streptomyces sp. SN-593]BBB00332.1 putative LysR family transcriptional regulator [Streptomyces sp. SN-593]
MEMRAMRAFVAVVEEQGLSAAARRLHISQPAVSQTIGALEREFGVQLLIRSSTGVQATESGLVLLAEARAILARYDQALATMDARTAAAAATLRIGIPVELPPDLLSKALLDLAVAYPGTRVLARHLSTADQLTALHENDLDLGILRVRPAGQEFDAMLVVEEPLGVLLVAERATGLAGPDGIRLDALIGLDWLGFPRSGSPAWYDELTAILRSHGIDPGPVPPPDGPPLIAEVKLASLSVGRSFTLAPEGWSQPLPDTVTWFPLVGNPIVRRTWAVWNAGSHRRDLGHLIATLDQPRTPAPG